MVFKYALANNRSILNVENHLGVTMCPGELDHYKNEFSKVGMTN
ncbi:hypothetical protein VCHA54P501_230072 [Vibrio chagasii]|nr:hypothetical protein VCHA54P501_230072 [Vibrio chagasii]